jgi:5-methyltetrahydrofolate--homocysteine methyltransferase
MRTSLDSLLKTGGTILADGAMGTVLMSMGLEGGESPVLWNETQPDRVMDVHRRYIEAGAQIILTNTFSGNRRRLALHGLDDRTVELNRLGASLAVKVADAAQQTVAVVGDIGPTGQVLEPLGDLSFDDAVQAFEEQAQAMYAEGIDAFWIETMYDLEEVRAAVEAVRRAAPDALLVATMTFDTNGRTMMGTTPEQASETLRSFQLAAHGGNCGNGVVEILTVVEKMHADAPDSLLVAKANAGIPHVDSDGETIYDATPDAMAEYAQKAKELGARIIGGCCGSTPEHIRAMQVALETETAGGGA